MSTYLVTGTSGFIAGRTASLLLEDGHTVVGVDNMNDYYDIRLKQHRLERLQEHSGFAFREADIEDMQTLDPLFSDYTFDAVVNLAARAGVRYSMENPHVYMSTNAIGTLNLLELMRRHGVEKFVLASTSSLYAGHDMPFLETLPVNTPLSPYAASKKAAEAMAYSYHHLYGTDVSVLRYFTVFGPAGRPDMSVFRFTKWIDEGVPIELFGDGSQSRDFTYVDDIARGTIKALRPLGYEIINLGGGRNPVSINTLISMIEENLGKQASINQKPFHKADMLETWADISKADALLEWRPEVSLADGIAETIAWYQNNHEWLRDVVV